MAKERGATQVVQMLVKRSRAQVVFAIQTACLLLIAGFVWGLVGLQGYEMLAIGIIAILALAELVLVVLFFRQEPESDELGIKPLTDDAKQLILNLPNNKTIVLDRRREAIVANGGDLVIPTDDIRFIQVDNSEDVRILVATQRDLLVVCHLVNPLPRERADAARVARRLSRSAQVPFED